MLQEQPLVSIIVPAYNLEKLLARCLQSIQAQTYENWECLVVNDGSADGTGQVCDAWAQKDSRFKAIHKQNGGVSSARNAALEQAAGQFLMFCDQDDLYAPQTIEYALQMQRAKPEALVTWAFTRDAQEFAQLAGQPLKYEEYNSQFIVWHATWFHTVWNRLFYADTVRSQGLRFDEALGWADRLGEDQDFNQQYMNARYGTEHVVVLRSPQPFYFYFPDNENSVTNNLKSHTGGTEETPQSGYCAELLTECQRVCPPNLGDMPLNDQREFLLHYFNCFAYGVWSTQKLGEPLPVGFWRNPMLKKMLVQCKASRLYSPYYLPFKLGFAPLVAQMHHEYQRHSIQFYRLNEIFYRLCCRGWQR